MKRLYIAPIFLALLTPLFAMASDSLFLQLPVLIDPAAPMPPAVKQECGVEMLLGNYALSEIGRRNGSVQSIATPDQAKGGKVVQLTILAVHGLGGGKWTGTKSMSIRVDLKKGDTALGSTVLNRSSGGGMFGGVSGTCAIFDRVAVALGKDVALWLSRGAPTRADEPASSASQPAEAPEVVDKKPEVADKP